MEPSLDENYRDMIGLLNAHGVDYLLVGAWAVSFHVAFRYTEDIDFWVRPTAENAAKLMEALKAFGAPLGDVEEKDFSAPRFGMHIGSPPCRIDLLTVVAGVTFDQAWKNKVAVELAGLPLYVMGKDDLIINKRAAGRDKDLRDVIKLEKGKSNG